MEFNQGNLLRSSAWVLFLCVTFATTSCGLIGGKDSGATTGTITTITGQSPLQAFEGGLYAMMTTSTRANCANCHSSIDTPYFAIPGNPLASCQALIAATNDFNLQNASGSTVATYFTVGGTGSCACSSSADCNLSSFNTAVQQWVGATQNGTVDPCSDVSPTGNPSPSPTTSLCAPGLVAPSGVAYVTQPITVPSPLPSASGGTGTILNFALSNVSPAFAGVSGGVFQVQVAQLSATTLSILAPRMAVPVAATVSGVHILLQRQGQGDAPCELPSGQSWTAVSVPVPASVVPNPVSTTTPLTATVVGTGNSAAPVLFNASGAPYVMQMSIGFQGL